MLERARQLGGIHLAKLFCLPVQKSATPLPLAELAIIKLLQSPIQLAYLQQLDILLIDELGMLLAKMSNEIQVFRKHSLKTNALTWNQHQVELI
jgi:hypothetical protein